MRVDDSHPSSAAGASQRCSALVRDTAGATALEFAFVGLIFFAFIYGIVGLGIQFFNATSLDFSVYEAARSLQTGTAQSGSATTADLFLSNYLKPVLYNLDYSELSSSNVNLTTMTSSNVNCDQSTPTSTCSTNLITQTPVFNSDGTVNYYVTNLKKLSNSYCVPGQGTVVYIQVTYPQTNVPSLNIGYGSLVSGLQSGATVMVEPYPGANSSTC
jgi:Flp pilus assembly protein TadG